MTVCITNWWGKLACRFEARYDTVPPPKVPDDGFSLTSHTPVTIELVKAMTEHRYAGDICTRCGKQVMRPEGGR
jgi:hypothetical protein